MEPPNAFPNRSIRHKMDQGFANSKSKLATPLSHIFGINRIGSPILSSRADEAENREIRTCPGVHQPVEPFCAFHPDGTFNLPSLLSNLWPLNGENVAKRIAPSTPKPLLVDMEATPPVLHSSSEVHPVPSDAPVEPVRRKRGRPRKERPLPQDITGTQLPVRRKRGRPRLERVDRSSLSFDVKRPMRERASSTRYDPGFVITRTKHRHNRSVLKGCQWPERVRVRLETTQVG